jgi:hypothetical protein
VKIVNVIRNYLSHDKCDELNAWVRNAIDTNKIDKGITVAVDGSVSTAALRYTSRMYANRFKYPQLVRDLHARIETEFNLTQWHYPVHTHGQDGVVVSATMPGGDVHLHKDPVDGQDPKHTLRCNILTSETAGGLIWIGNESYELNKGDMMQYLVSRHEHRVETVEGEPGDLRILWMFGWYVDGDAWEASIQN